MLLAVNVLDPRSLIEAAGLIGILVIVFAETGLLLGFFLPGDSLLFTAGIAASTGIGGVKLSLPALLILCPIAAIAGAQLGYVIGRRIGPALYRRPDSRLFRQEYVARAQHYFDRFGPPKAVVLARFVPIVRTFLNPVAGVLAMPVRTFTTWNIVGGILWAIGVVMLGYALGSQLPGGSIDRYLLPAVAVIIVLSLVPIAVELWRTHRSSST